MAGKRQAIKAIYDEELISLLESLGLSAEFDTGHLHCSICSEVITWNNLNIVYPESGMVRFICTNPQCALSFSERISDRTP